MIHSKKIRRSTGQERREQRNDVPRSSSDHKTTISFLALEAFQTEILSQLRVEANSWLALLKPC